MRDEQAHRCLSLHDSIMVTITEETNISSKSTKRHALDTFSTESDLTDADINTLADLYSEAFEHGQCLTCQFQLASLIFTSTLQTPSASVASASNAVRTRNYGRPSSGTTYYKPYSLDASYLSAPKIARSSLELPVMALVKRCQMSQLRKS